MNPHPQRKPPVRRGRSAAVRRLATSAVLSALGVVFLGVGALVEVLDLTAALAASLVILLLREVYGTREALLAYVVTAALGILLLPHSAAGWVFLALTGYYPILRPLLLRLPRLFAVTLRLVLVAFLLLTFAAAVYVLLLGGEGSFLGAIGYLFGFTTGHPLALLLGVGVAYLCFFIYDLMLGRLLLLYRLRWRRRVERWMRP